MTNRGKIMDKFNCKYDNNDFIELIKYCDGGISFYIKNENQVSEVVLSHADAKALAERLTDICRGVE